MTETLGSAISTRPKPLIKYGEKYVIILENQISFFHGFRKKYTDHFDDFRSDKHCTMILAFKPKIFILIFMPIINQLGGLPERCTSQLYFFY